MTKEEFRRYAGEKTKQMGGEGTVEDKLKELRRSASPVAVTEAMKEAGNQAEVCEIAPQSGDESGEAADVDTNFEPTTLDLNDAQHELERLLDDAATAQILEEESRGLGASSELPSNFLEILENSALDYRPLPTPFDANEDERHPTAMLQPSYQSLFVPAPLRLMTPQPDALPSPSILLASLAPSRLSFNDDKNAFYISADAPSIARPSVSPQPMQNMGSGIGANKAVMAAGPNQPPYIMFDLDLGAPVTAINQGVEVGGFDQLLPEREFAS